MNKRIMSGLTLTTFYICLLLLFSGCDMSEKEIMKLATPENCKYSLLCWKKFKDKSACEKFAIKCSEKLSEIDKNFKITK